MEWDMDYNEERTAKLIKKYKFDFSDKYEDEIASLLEQEFENYHQGSSEYLRFLCGYLYCIGNKNRLELIKKIKYKINMDVGSMIDWEWIESFENGFQETDLVRKREELIEDFTEWYYGFVEDSI